MVSNRIKYEIQDIAKYRKVLIKIIIERMHMLDLIKMRLINSIEYTDICENMFKFDRLCNANRIIVDYCYKLIISELHAVNTALECLRDNVGNEIWPKDINYDLITSTDNMNVENYYFQIVNEKKRLIKITCEEKKMVIRLIETNFHKHENIIRGAG